jgi:hypothetical protein
MLCNCNDTEKFENIANTDIEAIRNLNSIATKLTAGQLTSPGALSVTGDLNIGPGNKFKFNPGGDNWVRLFNANNQHADQGFAATRLWTQNLHGKPTVVDGIAGNLNVDGTITSSIVKTTTLIANDSNILTELNGIKDRLNNLEANVIYRNKITGSCRGWDCAQDGTVCLPNSTGNGANTIQVCKNSKWVSENLYTT